MGVRLAHHHQAGLKVARWLQQRPEIARVLHPALESDPGHALWRRDFSGASGLFSIVFKPVAQKAVNAFLDELALFGIGASWGGFESLAIPFDCTAIRTATAWRSTPHRSIAPAVHTATARRPPSRSRTHRWHARLS